jgi:uncharacterized protein (TIGR00290 family)
VVALAWSGGKDSALALAAMRAAGEPPDVLLTTVVEGAGRVSMHGVRHELVAAQADAARVPLRTMTVPWPCPNAVYEERLAQSLDGVDVVAFGDLFLADIRFYREQLMGRLGREPRFPVWREDTGALAREFIAAGFEATLVCVDTTRLDGAFAGRSFDAALLDDLPAGADPCGENGEFHTFVHAGPIFDAPIACGVGAIELRDGFAFADLRGQTH